MKSKVIPVISSVQKLNQFVTFKSTSFPASIFGKKDKKNNSTSRNFSYTLGYSLTWYNGIMEVSIKKEVSSKGTFAPKSAINILIKTPYQETWYLLFCYIWILTTNYFQFSASTSPHPLGPIGVMVTRNLTILRQLMTKT